MKTRTLEQVPTPNLTAPLHLLILEHSPHFVERMLQHFSEFGYLIDPTLAENQAQFQRALQANSFDAVVADDHLPGWTGMEALKELRASGKDIPFLFLTGTPGEEAAIECLKQGASEVIFKEHLSLLPLALRHALLQKELHEAKARALVALAESEARARRQFAELELLYHTAPVGIAVFGPDLRYLRVNEELARTHGLPAAEHAGRSLRELMPEIAEEVESCLRRVFSNGEVILNVEISGTSPAQPGVLRHWLASFYPLFAEDGTLFAACAIVPEITERKLVEEAMRLSEARNRDLVENAVHGIFRASSDGTLLDANPALLHILGCSSLEELQEVQNFRNLFRYPEQHAQLMASCRELGLVHGAETQWRRKDGGIVTVRLHLRRFSILKDPGVIEVIAEDVTQLRALERQLRQAQKFDAIGQLAGGIAHDFNNVVGAILGWAELGCDQNQSNPPVAERFTRIREQAERAAALTRELLAFARRQVLQPRAVDLNAVTRVLVSFLDKVIAKDIELKVVTAPLDPIKADPTQIEQVLMNLCLNARDAMPKGGRLVIETQMVELDDSFSRSYPDVLPGRYAVLSVSDTGVGMDTETRERIFEPFFTTKERGKGAGMGLATVYGIVKQHGGFVHVYSELQHGTLLRVYLPVMMGAAAEGVSPAPPIQTLADLHGTETILIAEDHESIREMARQTLVGFGYRVLSACDGEEALRLCEKDPPDLAILDLIMPKMGGPEVAAELVSRFAALPILYTSGYSPDHEEVAHPGARTGYLQKPYSPTILGRLVREMLNQRKSASA